MVLGDRPRERTRCTSRRRTVARPSRAASWSPCTRAQRPELRPLSRRSTFNGAQRRHRSLAVLGLMYDSSLWCTILADSSCPCARSVFLLPDMSLPYIIASGWCALLSITKMHRLQIIMLHNVTESNVPRSLLICEAREFSATLLIYMNMYKE